MVIFQALLCRGSAARLSCGAGAAIPSNNGQSPELSLTRNGNLARGTCWKLAPRPSGGYAPI